MLNFPTGPHSTTQLAAAAVLLVLFPVLIWQSGCAGIASLLSNYAAQINQIAPANTAVSSAPEDPEAHYLRGAVLDAGNDLTGAITEYEKATSLRPDDFVLWLNLARARESNGDIPEAIAAARQAVPLAPYYAEPHWQLGNILIRAGQSDEGFKELRLAGASNPTLLPGIIDLAWQVSKGDAQFVMRVLAPQSTESHQALADYFRKHGKLAEAISSYHAAGSGAEPKRKEFLAELIAAKNFTEAYRLWSLAHGGRGGFGGGIGILNDAGLEQEDDLDAPGFGWRRSNKAASISLSLDPTNPHEGRSSLVVEFKGESDPGAPFISQMVLVAPNTHYQLAFAARTDSIVSGGLPRVVVMDAGDNQLLGTPVSLPQQSVQWQNYTIDFNSKDTTTAIIISCSRASCASGPCPIFGRLWLDSFSLRKL